MDASGQIKRGPTLITCNAPTTTEAVDFLFKGSDALPLTNFLADDLAHLWDEIGMSLGLPKAVRAECGESHMYAARLCNILLKWITGKYRGAVPPTMKKLKEALAGPFVQHEVLASNLEQYKQPVKETASFPSDEAHKASLYGKDNRDILVHRYLREPEVVSDQWPPVVTENFINLALVKPSDKLYKSDYSVSGNADTKIASKVKIEYREAFVQFLSESNTLVIGRPGSGKTTLLHKIVKDWAKGEVLEEAELVFLISLRAINTKQNRDTSLFDILRPYYRQVEDLIKRLEQTHGKQACFVLDGFDEYNPSDKSDSLILALLDKSYLPNAMVIISSRPAAASANLKDELLSKKIEVFGFPSDQVQDYIDCFPFSCSDGLDAEHHRTNLKEYLNSHPDVADLCYLPVNLAIICFIYEYEPKNIPQTLTKLYENFAQLIVIRHLSKKCGDNKIHLKSLDYLDKDNYMHFRKLCKLAFKMTTNSKLVITEKEILSNDSLALGLATVDIIASLNGFDNTFTFLHLTLQEYLAAYYLSTLPAKNQKEIIMEHSDKNYMLTVWKFYFGITDFSIGRDRAEGIFSGVKKIIYEYHSHEYTLFKMQCAYESQKPKICNLSSCESFSCFVHDLNHSDFRALAYVMNTNAAQPRSIPTVALSFTYFDAHKFELFMEQLGKEALSKLTEIELSVNDDMDINNMKMLQSKLQYTKLETLKLDDLDLDFAKVLMSKVDLRSIKRLYLTGCCIESDGAVILAKYLEKSSRLQVLDLSDNGVGYSGMKALAGALRTCPELKYLNISNNGIVIENMESLVDTVQCKNDLKQLDLSNNNLGGNNCVTSIQTIFNLVGRQYGDNTGCEVTGNKNYSTLVYLILSNNSIDLDCAVKLSDHIFEYCIFLQRLNLSRNKIGSTGVIKIFLKLLRHSELVTLDLSYNDKTEYDEEDVSNYFSSSINLSHNNLGNSHIVELSEGIKNVSDYCTLIHIYYRPSFRDTFGSPDLDLSFNDISIDDARSLLSALQTCDGMITINLTDNPIPNDAYSTGLLKSAFQHPDLERNLRLHGEDIEIPPRKFETTGEND